MHKVAIIILAGCFLMTVSCTPRWEHRIPNKDQGRYIAIQRKAQNPDAKGIIRGVVTDSYNSRNLPYAKVILVGVEIDTFTNLDGYYELEVPHPGKYQIEARMMGYHVIRTDSIKVQKGEIIVLNFEMSLVYLYPEGGIIYHR